MERADRHRNRADRDADAAAAADETIARTTAMLVATVVSMWALSAMAVTVRHGRSRMARWTQQQQQQQQQHNGLHPPQPSTSTRTVAALQVTAASVVTVSANDRLLHDPGGGLSQPATTLQVGGVDGQLQHHREKANSLLRIVESQQHLGDNCTAGTDLNMGEGVVDRYAQVRRRLRPVRASCLPKNTDSLPSLSIAKCY